MDTLTTIKNKLLSREDLETKLLEWRSLKKNIVFTNGCFDILHRGHVEYLAQASDLGDKLIVGLNTDASVKRLKGETRPVNDEQSRALLLSALQFVDAVVLFGEDTPYELIKQVQPDVLVKGNDYRPEEIIGYDIVTAKCGKVLTINFVDGFSTTNIIKRM